MHWGGGWSLIVERWRIGFGTGERYLSDGVLVKCASLVGVRRSGIFGILAFRSDLFCCNDSRSDTKRMMVLGGICMYVRIQPDVFCRTWLCGRIKKL